ncbi:MAG TPA: hydrolase [Gemmatimonadaceae bacterium]
MTETFRPAWWLPDPHTQTLWPRFFRTRPRLNTVTERWETPDGDEIDVIRLGAAPGSPRLILVHGLEGSVRSHYVGGLLHAASRRSWGGDLLIFRTCNGEVNLARRSYHSGETEDLDLVVRRVAAEYPRAPLGLVGVSLGGNVVLKWLGERAGYLPAQVAAAVAISTPFDLARSARRIGQGFSRVYERHFLRSLRAKALAKIERFPDLARREAVLAARTIWEFDDAYTAAVHGFRDAADYYAQSSSIRFLDRIRVPTLLLSARDDPFHPPEVLSDVERIARSNPHLVTDFPARGGHVGFVEGAGPWRTRSYAESRAVSFLAQKLQVRPGA